MKKTLLIALLLIPFIGFSQTTKPIDGFQGIKFGSSKITVLTAMKAKGYKFDKTNSTATMLAFSNVKLASHTADAFLVKFINDKAFESDYLFNPDVEAKVIADYDELAGRIAEIYGQGQVTKTYNNPYKEDDGETLLGLSAGKIDFHTVWFADNKNSISIAITTDMIVRVTYQDYLLTEQAIQAQKAKDKGDF
jgi:hypothetical protein